MTSVYDFAARDIEGRERPLREFEGRVLLIVNVASQCAFTPQYEGLEALWRTYGNLGFAVLGFPCNQFGKQEPGEGDEIKSFCTTRYGVTFPMFAKIDVNGPAAHPLFAWLANERPGALGTRALKWNFTKFLVDRRGCAVRRFAPRVPPARIAAALERLL